MRVIKPGFYTSVQDLGRYGCAHLGIPVAGAMDQTAYQLANHLIKNPPNAACLEMTMTGATISFDRGTQILMCGAEGLISINSIPKQLNQILSIQAGDILEIGNFKSGQRMYMAINGGVGSEMILKSRSFYKGITSQEKIKEGDWFYYPNVPFSVPSNFAHVKPRDWNQESIYLDAYSGPEFHLLSEWMIHQLFQKSFTISPVQNRMGIQLKETIPNKLKEILTSPVYPGTVQLTPSGRLILLMRDAQVTGGYPRILQLSHEALSILSQKRQEQVVRFKFLEGG